MLPQDKPYAKSVSTISSKHKSDFIKETFGWKDHACGAEVRWDQRAE